MKMYLRDLKIFDSEDAHFEETVNTYSKPIAHFHLTRNLELVFGAAR